MSTWRDIWRYGVIANRFYSEDIQKGEEAFAKLIEVYDKQNKKDGMIRYIMAEAYELKYYRTKDNQYKEKALEYYKYAKELFPVDHWKTVAQDSVNRLSPDIPLTPKQYYKIDFTKNEKNETIPSDDTEFTDLLWYVFQEVYRFVHISDFARYVCLSALSRGSSEWPLSLVDFRTVLELEIKQCFPKIIDSFDDTNRYSLFKTINILSYQRKINYKTKCAFNEIRIAGNIAAHNLYTNNTFNKTNVLRFHEILQYFDSHRKNIDVSSQNDIPYPLCQIDLKKFLEELDKEKELLKKNGYYE